MDRIVTEAVAQEVGNIFSKKAHIYPMIFDK